MFALSSIFQAFQLLSSTSFVEPSDVLIVLGSNGFPIVFWLFFFKSAQRQRQSTLTIIK
jgi:hypothetical protein